MVRFLLFLFISLNLFSYEKSVSDKLFGTNKFLMQIIYNEHKTTQKEFENKKDLYLRKIVKKDKKSPLYLRAKSSKNLTENITGYDIKLEYNIYNGNKNLQNNKFKNDYLKKEYEYEQFLDRYKTNYFKSTIYEIDKILNYINYLYSKEQVWILIKIYKRIKKRFNSSLVSQEQLKFYKNQLIRGVNQYNYYKKLDFKQYDKSLKTFMKNIENFNLTNKNTILENAYKNNFDLNSYKNYFNSIQSQKSWKDDLKVNLFVQNKKYNYLKDRSNSVVGVSLNMPIDFNNKADNKEDDANIQTQLKSLNIEYKKRLIQNNINDIFQKIKLHQYKIKSLKSDIVLAFNNINNYYIKLKYPLPKQKDDFIVKIYKEKIKISQKTQQIWLTRTDILKLLLKLQHISGINILPKYL